MSAHSFIPKKRTTFEFKIPEFDRMAPSDGATPNSPLTAAAVARANLSPTEQWESNRKEALVEVSNLEGKTVVVSRHLLVKSRNNQYVSTA